MQEHDFRAGFPGRLVVTDDGVQTYVPNPLPPNISYDAVLARRLAAAASAVGQLEGALTGGKVAPFLISYPLMQREAIFSNRIEGTYTTPVEMALFDVGAPEAQHEGGQAGQTREVVNYVKAMETGLRLLQSPANLPVCSRLMKQVHAVLVHGTRGDDKLPGEFRDRQNFIGRGADGIREARFVPPPPTEMRAAMGDLERFINEGIGPESEIDAFVGVALVHYQFETIHPFVDGNGRIGRLLVPLMLVERGVVTQPLLHVSSTLDRRQQEYRDLMLAVSQRGAWGDWICFFLNVIEQSAQEALGKAESLGRLYDEYQTKVRARRASALLARLVDRLFQVPSISIKDAEAVMGVSYPQAAEHVHRLEELGILIEISGKPRNKRFASKEILDRVFA